MDGSRKKITLEVSGGATEFVFHAVYSACEHKWDEGKIIKEPTYDQEGIKGIPAYIVQKQKMRILKN